MFMTVSFQSEIGRAVRNYLPVKRALDITISAVALVVLLPVLLIIAILVRLTSRGPALYWSVRQGRNDVPFNMPKFRSMKMGAPCVPTLHLDSPETWVTPIGRFLRKTSLDEMPQLWSILNGDMSFIGPRAVLVEEVELLAERKRMGIHLLRPGISGWAQVNGRDTISIPEKVALDFEYLMHCSISFDLMISLKTIKRVLRGEDVSH